MKITSQQNTVLKKEIFPILIVNSFIFFYYFGFIY